MDERGDLIQMDEVSPADWPGSPPHARCWPVQRPVAGFLLLVGMSTAATGQALLPGLQGADHAAEPRGLAATGVRGKSAGVQAAAARGLVVACCSALSRARLRAFQASFTVAT